MKPWYDPPEPPLTNRELRIIRCLLQDDPALDKLRGMIDDHEFQLEARRRWGLLLKDVRGVAALLGATTLVALQVAELWVILAH